MCMRYKYAFSIITIIFIFFGLLQVKTFVLAEQSGSSPESGVTSRIKTIYDSLVSLTHGSDSAGGWGNWGVMWNRIRSAAEWVPTGDATEADVASGKTFYKDSRTQISGTAPPAFDYSTQSKVIWDDYRNGGGADGDSAGEESIWTNTAGAPDTGVWKDTTTGLYWSSSQGSITNIFTTATCDYFSTSARGNYAGGDSDCGNAINACATLALDATGDGSAEDNWYLPSQKELMVAYADGIFNTDTTFATMSYYWSSTEVSDLPNNAWRAYLFNGFTLGCPKSSANPVHCVRRD